MEYQTVRPLDGRSRPDDINWIGDIKDQDYRQGGSFVDNPTNPGEIKFHNGADDLSLSGVWMDGTRYGSYQEYLDAREEIYMF